MVLVGVTDANATTFNVIDTIYSTTVYDKYTVYLDAASGVGTGDARVAFAWIWDNTLSPAYDYVYIDDVTIKDIPPCPEPIGLSLVSATQSSGTISWSSSSAAFNIEVGPMGFTQGTGTSYLSTTTSYTATGLTQNTDYDVYVMANCTSTGDGTSNWVGPFTFKTECGDQEVPYSTGFEGYASGSSGDPNLPNCWKYAKTGNSSSFYAYNYSYSYYANTGTNSLRFYGYASTASTNSADGDTLAAFSPRIRDLNDNLKQVVFSVRTSSSVAYYNSKIIIATADSNASLESIHIVDTVNYSNVYQQFTVDLTGLPNNASRVVFMIVPEFIFGYTYSYTYAYVDDIEIKNAPGCPTPENLEVVSTSDTSVVLSWDGGGNASSYTVEWIECGNTVTVNNIPSTTNSVVLDTLNSGTCYSFRVKASCPSQVVTTSSWSISKQFTTPCSPTTVPWADGFETSPANSGNSQNPTCQIVGRTIQTEDPHSR